MPFSVTRQFSFDAAHRVLGHLGRCRYLHGHHYTVDLTVTSEVLDGLGMVVDFSLLKSTVGVYLDEEFDHNIIFHEHDPLLAFTKKFPAFSQQIFDGRDPCVMDCNPTAENLARLVHAKAVELLAGRGLTVARVLVRETPTCLAEYAPPVP